MQANDKQVGGDHYRTEYQHWDLVRELGLDYFPAQITRYVSRWRKKNGIEDLRKAVHYIEKFIEEERMRHAMHLGSMEAFLRLNTLQEHERIVFNMLINYRLGDFERLTEARHQLEELISILEGKATTPVDPKFKDEGDEWRR